MLKHLDQQHNYRTTRCLSQTNPFVRQKTVENAAVPSSSIMVSEGSGSLSLRDNLRPVLTKTSTFAPFADSFIFCPDQFLIRAAPLFPSARHRTLLLIRVRKKARRDQKILVGR